MNFIRYCKLYSLVKLNYAKVRFSNIGPVIGDIEEPNDDLVK